MESTSITKFEELSQEILICIIEYLSLEDLISIFDNLNSQLTSFVLDHPWVQHTLSIETSDDNQLKKKLDFVENMKLTTRITAIKICPFSIYHTIEAFHKYKSLDRFVNLRALFLNHITLREAESIFSSSCLANWKNLNHLNVVFSCVIEANDDAQRMESIISNILAHPSLRSCTIRAPQSIEFSQVKSPTSITHLDIEPCSFESIYTLLEFTPSLHRLSATIAVYKELEYNKIAMLSSVKSLRLQLSIDAFDDLMNLLTRFPKLQKLHVITYSLIESATCAQNWFPLIFEHLSQLIKFKRESNVHTNNVEAYVDPFKWENGWRLEQKSTKNGDNYLRLTITNSRT